MFGLCSIPLCFHQASRQCLACHKSYCPTHLYEAAVQSSKQSGYVPLCERCLQEQRPFTFNTAHVIRPAKEH